MKRSHVKEQKSHRFPKNESKKQLWKGKVDKDLDGFIVSDKKVVCLTSLNMRDLLMLHQFHPCL